MRPPGGNCSFMRRKFRFGGQKGTGSASRMAMPVMEVRPVRVRVRQRLVLVPVLMDQGRRLFMIVAVMPVVVPMYVRVRERVVNVRMPVPSGEHHANSGCHQQRGRELGGNQGLPEQHCRNHHAEEWRRCE